MTPQNLSSFIWSVADPLRGDYKQSEYGKVILPFTELLRLDCVLESTKEAVLAEQSTLLAASLNPERVRVFSDFPNWHATGLVDGMTKPTNDNTEPAEVRLFEDLPEPSVVQLQQAQAKATTRRGQGTPRLLQPNHLQIELRAPDLESLLAQDHRARLVWGYVVHQDLGRLFDAVKARGSNAGRAAIDPRILFALWLYTTLDGVGSGREVARLSQEHDAYRWICGGVSVNYHAINDFRSGNEALMDELLTDNVAALAAAGAISLARVAQDGMRVRADAGTASFRRQASLHEHLKEASELVQTLKTQARSDPDPGFARR